MAIQTKFGRQPAMDELMARKISVKAASIEMEVPYRHLRFALYGYVTPKNEVRDGLEALLGLPREQLFTEESLAAKPHYGVRARQQLAAARREARRIKAQRLADAEAAAVED